MRTHPIENGGVIPLELLWCDVCHVVPVDVVKLPRCHLVISKAHKEHVFMRERMLDERGELGGAIFEEVTENHGVLVVHVRGRGDVRVRVNPQDAKVVGILSMQVVKGCLRDGAVTPKGDDTPRAALGKYARSRPLLGDERIWPDDATANTAIPTEIARHRNPDDLGRGTLGRKPLQEIGGKAILRSVSALPFGKQQSDGILASAHMASFGNTRFQRAKRSPFYSILPEGAVRDTIGVLRAPWRIRAAPFGPRGIRADGA